MPAHRGHDSTNHLGVYARLPARIVGALVYSLVLFWIYADRVSPGFAYIGYTYRTPPMPESIYVLTFVGIVAAVMPQRVSRTSDFVLWVLFIVAIAPSMTVPMYHASLSDGQSLAVSATTGASFLATIIIARRAHLKLVPQISLSPHSMAMAIGFISLAVYGYITLSTGLRIRLVGLLDVYSLREEYRADIALSSGGILGYLIPWQGYVINPLITVYGILSRRPVLVAVGLIGQLLLFSSTGLKSILLSGPALFLVLFIFRGNRRPTGSFLLWGAIAMTGVVVAVDWIRQSNLWSQILIRRFLLTPGMLMSVYVAFFTEQPKMYLSHSVLESFIDNPYQGSYTFAVGRTVTGRSDTAVNASAYADGFANAGLLGILIVGVVVGLVLALLDDAARDLPLSLTCAVLLLPSIALSNSAITTSLLTHGIGLCILMLALAPRHIWTPKSSKVVATFRRLST